MFVNHPPRRRFGHEKVLCRAGRIVLGNRRGAIRVQKGCIPVLSLPFVLLVPPVVPAVQAQPVLLLANRDNYTAQGLKALGVPHDTVTVTDLIRGSDSLFAHPVLVIGFDVDRRGLTQRKDSLRLFVEQGGVVLAFRGKGTDDWLPSPVRHDVAYMPGKVLVRTHPIFNTPHKLNDEALARVHGGSIYAGFHALGKGWRPLFSTGPQQGWDKSNPADKGEHYGIVEGQWGKGRIVLVQLIPAYGWFHDHGGDPNTDSARLFENLIRYALNQAVKRPPPAKPRRRPECYASSLAEVLRPPRGREGLSLADPAWTFSGKGPFTGKCDRRGVFTISHPNVPSVAGNFGQVSRSVPLPPTAEQVFLRVYQSDDYCGGVDPKMVGDRVVSREVNRKGNKRFRQVLVGGKVVHEEDVLGRNPNPAIQRIQWFDITAAVRGKRKVEVALRLLDKQGCGDEPFATDAFFACIAVRTDLRRIPARKLIREGFALDGEQVVLAGAKGKLTFRVSGLPAANYVLAVKVRDDAYAQSLLELRVDGRRVQRVVLSADDFRHYYLTTPTVALEPGDTIELTAVRDGDEAVAVSELAILPADLVEPLSTERKREPYYRPGPRVRRREVSLVMAEPAGVARVGELASQAVPFGYGALRSPDHLAVVDSSGVELPVQTRVVTRWPDESLQSVVVQFPARVDAKGKSRYVLRFGEGVRRTAKVRVPVRVDRRGNAVHVDTGPLQVVIPTGSGELLSKATLNGRNLSPPGRPWCAEVENEVGAVFSSGGDTVAAVEVAESGPLRVLVVKRGRHRNKNGDCLDYRFEYQFTAGAKGFRFFYTFSNTTLSAGVNLKRVTLRLPWESRSHTLYFHAPGAERLEPVSDGRLEAYQHLHDLGTVHGGGKAMDRQPLQLAGLFAARGDDSLHVGLRYGWQLYPKRALLHEGITLDLLPRPLTEADIPAVAKARPETPGNEIGGIGYPQADGKPGMFRVAVGESITHELWIEFAAGDTPLTPATFRARFHPLRAAVEPAYVAGTKVFAEFHPRDPKLFPRYEAGVDQEYEVFMKRRRDRKQYGMENFGDDTFEWGYGPVYTFWSNEEDDRTHGMLMEYLRSGQWRWWELGEQAARHYRDVDCVLAAPDSPALVGGPRHHNNRHFVSKGWVADHTHSGAYTGHSWIEGLLDYWLLTGDLLTGAAALRMGDWYVRQVADFHFGAGGQERGLGWTLTGLTSLYRATWDKRYLDAALKVQAWIQETQDPVRGVLSVPISEQPSYEGGTTFMHGIVGHGIARLCDVTDDPRVLRSLEGIAAWIVTEPMDPHKPGAFWYKQAPTQKHGYGYNTKAMAALSYVYRMTGDEYLGFVADEIVAHSRPTIRSMPFFCSTLAHVARYRKTAQRAH